MACTARLLYWRHLAPFPGKRHSITSPWQQHAAQRGQGGAVRLFLTNLTNGRAGSTVAAPLAAALGPLR